MEEAMEKVEGEETVSELDALKLENESLKSELKVASEKIAGMAQTLAEKDKEIDALNQSVTDAVGMVAEVKNVLHEAVAAYRGLLVGENPGLVAELIKGETIEEVNESLKSTRALVEKVKLEVDAENAKVRVPAGAPQRTVLDLSTLSPREKIRYGIEGG